MHSLISRSLMAIALAGLFPAGNAFADKCADQADAKKLSGTARAGHIRRCEAYPDGAHDQSCVYKAEDKKLAGTALTQFIRKCEAESSKK
ncbi:MAG: hypothetical protein ABI630_10955 [Betaproteobacteria bacterium]